ncbi:hypothetical protein QEO96_09315 [Kingella negevensis]|uniref:hypothetical protein n=1 Tax=Kingella negevensis TaxID=1522312 RepID=UPI00254FEDD1|nr:hypothetical protein [Kingella negevensis]MDK4693736.1 hypothetical protein [Kingella negevensis]
MNQQTLFIDLDTSAPQPQVLQLRMMLQELATESASENSSECSLKMREKEK